MHVWQADENLICQRADRRENDFASSIIFGDEGAESGVSWYHARSCPMHTTRVSPHGSHQPAWLRADTTCAEKAPIDPRVGPACMLTPANTALRLGTDGRIDHLAQPPKEPAPERTLTFKTPLLLGSAWRKPPMEAPRCMIILPCAAYMAGAILIAGSVVYWLRDVLTCPGIASNRCR